MKRIYFGTDGVRGPYGGPVINEAFAERLGLAAGLWSGGRGRVVIGRDTRASGQSLAGAVAVGLRAAGLEPVMLGVVPTPAVARTVVASGAALGVVVTASHNPASDNGIKFFSGTGMKLTDEDEAAIEALFPAVSPVSVGTAATDASSIEQYCEAVGSLLPKNALAGWRIVLDTAHGATCVSSPRVLRALGAEVLGIGDAPDGININHEVGSEHPERMAVEVRAKGARLGIAHDGDGDRCVLSDETGDVLDGDEILTILALHALRNGRLAANELVVTMQSNLGVDAVITAAGGTVARTSIGDRYVMERMRASGATLGGESSGHVICSDVLPTGDGLVAAIKVIAVMLETGRPLSELRRALRKFPQRASALRVKIKRPMAELSALTSEIAALERELGTRGRVLVRYSGTEPKLRLLIEGPTDDLVDRGLQRLEAAASHDLEVI
ncbi:phosphoglucosamine mutase [Opitutaceae bacterium]